MKLQKQLRAYAKQIQDFTGECLHGEGGRLVWGCCPTQPQGVGTRAPPNPGELFLG